MADRVNVMGISEDCLTEKGKEMEKNLGIDYLLAYNTYDFKEINMFYNGCTRCWKNIGRIEYC